ncbi:hypothetical protein MNL09_06830 [Bartonella krasnovii]|nr:hypothetical protein MNL09_06830 [Bartonella krasnovii]
MFFSVFLEPLMREIDAGLVLSARKLAVIKSMERMFCSISFVLFNNFQDLFCFDS